MDKNILTIMYADTSLGEQEEEHSTHLKQEWSIRDAEKWFAAKKEKLAKHLNFNLNLNRTNISNFLECFYTANLFQHLVLMYFSCMGARETSV